MTMSLVLSPNQALAQRASAELAIREAETTRDIAIAQVAEALQPYVGKLVALQGYATSGIYADLENSTYQAGPTGEELYHHKLSYRGNKLLAASMGGIIVAKEADDTRLSLDGFEWRSRDYRQEDDGSLIGYHIVLGNLLSLEEATVSVEATQA